ncbi:Flp pilus assembly protein CpaB [Neomicrococcus lactis]
MKKQTFDARKARASRRRRGRTFQEWRAKYRRVIAALLAGVAVALTLIFFAPRIEPTRSVLVAARDLPAGHQLAAADLATVNLASDAIPPSSVRTAGEITGQQLAVPIERGAPIPRSSLVGPGLLTGAPPGTSAVPVRAADAEGTSILRPGMNVNVVLTTGNGYETPTESRIIARNVVVLWNGDQSSGSSTSWLSSSKNQPGTVVVAAPEDDAARLAGATTEGKVSLVISSSD